MGAQDSGPLVLPTAKEVEAITTAANGELIFADIELTGRTNEAGGKEYRIAPKPVPDDMLRARKLPDVDVPRASRFVEVIEVKSFGVLGKDAKNEGDGWQADTAICDAAGLAGVSGLIKGEKLDDKWGPKKLKFAAKAIVDGVYGEDKLPECYPSSVSERLTGPGKVASEIYTGDLGAFAGEKTVIHALGMNYDASKIHHGFPSVLNADESIVIAIQSHVYVNVLRECLALMQTRPRIRKYRLLPISGGSYAGTFAKAMPRITWEAIYAAVRLLSVEEQEALLASSCTIDMCLFSDADQYAKAKADILQRLQALPKEKETVSQSWLQFCCGSRQP